MNKFIVRTALTSVTALALFGGADLLTNGNVPLTQTVVAQAKTVSRSQFLSDVEVIRKAALNGSSNMQDQVDLDTVSQYKSDPLGAYTGNDYATSFAEAIGSYHYSLSNEEDDDGNFLPADFEADYNGLTSIYKQFRSRLSSSAQDSLDNYQAKSKTSNMDDRAAAAIQLADGLATAVSDYGRTVTKVQPVAKANKVYGIDAKKSGKYVIIFGKVTNNRLTNAALAKTKNFNRAQITTYRGKKIVKINGQHKFKLKVYAPKAKTLKVNAGGMNGSKYASITKTVKASVR
ncbi:hypothetical protein [Levilactobacillus cerevisiae]|uniref:hypothetical protein n=1 Tax=Levilactobacillus cerevisiae TaxID=1704076 RepID=UPI00345EC328